MQSSPGVILTRSHSRAWQCSRWFYCTGDRLKRIMQTIKKQSSSSTTYFNINNYPDRKWHAAKIINLILIYCKINFAQYFRSGYFYARECWHHTIYYSRFCCCSTFWFPPILSNCEYHSREWSKIKLLLLTACSNTQLIHEWLSLFRAASLATLQPRLLLQLLQQWLWEGSGPNDDFFAPCLWLQWLYFCERLTYHFPHLDSSIGLKWRPGRPRLPPLFFCCWPPSLE